MTPSSSSSRDSQQARFVQLLMAAHGKLLGYLMSLLGRRHDAEDVLQKASVTMWQKFNDFEPGTDFIAWASTIAFYEAKNFQRLAARSPLVFNDELLAMLSAERLEDLPHVEARTSALHHCLKKLGEPRRKLVLAAYQDGADIASLAEKLNRAPQTIYNKLHNIRRVLALCVQRQLAEEAS